jgi:hypothetical protein
MAVLNERYATPARSIWEWANPLPHFAPDASRKAGAAVCGFVQDRDRIVTDHGFWELGRFSVALFGESPSVTLRRPAEQGFTSRLMMPAPVLTSARPGRLLWRSNSSGEAMSATPTASPRTSPRSFSIVFVREAALNLFLVLPNTLPWLLTKWVPVHAGHVTPS